MTNDDDGRELMRQLEDAGIEAFLADERSPAQLYLGGTISKSVWVKLEDDLPRAAQMLQSIIAARNEERDPVEDVACPACGEVVPTSFEVCWSCGRSMHAA